MSFRGIPQLRVASSWNTRGTRIAFWFILHLMAKAIESNSPRSKKLVRSTSEGKGQRVGYTRVSTLDQNDARQLDGLGLDRRFLDKLSGKDVARPQLEAMLSFIREGDTLVCHSMDRLGRSNEDLLRLVRELSERGVRVEFLKENLIITGDDTPWAKLVVGIFAAFSQFERELGRERQREGIAIAKREGKYKGRAPALASARADELRRRVAEGEGKAALAREFGVDRKTVYRYLEFASGNKMPTQRSGGGN